MTAALTTDASPDPRPLREQRWQRRFEVPTIIAALLVIPDIVLEESGLQGGWQDLATALNWVIWAVFAAQVATMMVVAGSRRGWLRNHVLELLIVVLTPPFLPAPLEAARVLRLLRLLRIVVTARSLRSFFSLHGLMLASLIAVFGVLGAGALFVTVEAQQHLSTWDGVWWAINTVATAGNDITPHTTGGRVIAIALLIVGVGYIAVLTGAMAQFFVRAMRLDAADVTADVTRDVDRQIDAVRAELAALREELAASRSAAVADAKSPQPQSYAAAPSPMRELPGED